MTPTLRISPGTRLLLGMTAAALGLIGLAGCSAPAADDSTSGGASDAASAPADSASAPATDAVLTTADSDLGQIVVDGKGMTVYMFDKDSQGATSSACSGQCATTWPAVTTDSDSPAVEGVDGEVGTITGLDGKPQVTLNGWPLYYFASDAAAGDTAGQGVGGVWWVLTPSGEKIAG